MQAPAPSDDHAVLEFGSNTGTADVAVGGVGTDVSRVALPLGVFSGDLPPLPSAPDPEHLLVLSQPLAESWPGQVARQIAEQVAAASAPGPSELDEHHYEVSAPVLHAEKAFWSPDGSMGLLR